MKKELTVALVAGLSVLSLPSVSFAQTNCDGIYGGGTNCGTNGFTLKKQVANPTNNQFVDSLGINDPHYKPGNLIYFKFTVTNNTNSNLTGVTLTDTLPNYITYSSMTSSNGKYQTSHTGNTVTTNLNTVNKGQTITITLTGILAKTLKAQSQVVCEVNQAQANASNGQGTQASTQFCIDNTQNQPVQQSPIQLGQTTKGGLPVTTPTPIPSFPVYTPSNNAKQTPKSGPETLPLLAMIPTGALGMWIRRKATK